MNTYSKALRHISMKDVKQKHQQKLIEQKIQQEKKKEEEEYIASVMEEKKYDWREKLNEQMTTSDVFFATLPATGNVDLNYPSWNPLDGYNYSVSGGTLTITNNGSGGPENGVAASFDTSKYDTLFFDVTLTGVTAIAVYQNGALKTGGVSSGTYSISVSQSPTSAILFIAPSLSVGTVAINNLRFQRRTPLNVFVSLDSPEASAFIRTDPIMANLSPQERLKKLKDMLEASDEYVTKMLGLDFPGTGAVAPGEYDPFKQAPPGEAGDTPGIEMTDYQNKLAAYEKALAADKQKSDELSKAVAAARAAYLKSGQTVAGRQQSYNNLQAAIKAGTDHALSTLRNPITKPTPPATQTSQSKFTPQQLADIDKQIKDLQAQSEKNKQDAVNNQWKAAAELGLGVAGVVGGVGVLAKIPAAVRAAQTVSQVRQATRAYNTYKALEKIKDAAATRQMTRPGTYTANPNPNRTPVKGGMMYKNSYEPQGEVISEKRKLKSPQEVLNKIPGYYDGKPAPLGFPETPPPEMVNGMHPDLVDGKKVADRFNRLDPESAKAMPPTGNPHIDKKVRAAAKKPK